MYVAPEQVASLVESQEDAEAVITHLLTRFTGGVAFTRLAESAQWGKQSVQETARRVSSNLLTSLRTNKSLY
jgi:hypothetical protein